jgi:hypothetical protein
VLVTVGGAATWGTTLGNTSDTFSIAGNIVSIDALTNFAFAASSGTLLSGRDLDGTTRRVLGLFRDVTSTQLPANTGDSVLYWGDAAVMPTTGFPVDGGVIGSDTNQGLQWKGKNGVETTIAPHGDAGNTTKRRMIGYKTQPLRGTHTIAGVNTINTFDVASLNGAAITSGVLKAVCHFILTGSSGAYTSCGHVMACVLITGGVPVVGGSKPEVEAGSLTALSSLTVDVSGTTVRFRATPEVTDFPYQIFSYWEIDEFEP